MTYTTQYERNLAALPPSCYAVLPSNKQLIKIDRDEMGYRPMLYDGKHVFGEAACEMADELNESLGISKPQVRAMFQGSMFGWDCPAADPEHKLNQLD